MTRIQAWANIVGGGIVVGILLAGVTVAVVFGYSVTHGSAAKCADAATPWSSGPGC